MFDWNAVVDALFRVLGPVFKERAVAPLIICPAFIIFAVLQWWRVGRALFPFRAAVQERVRAITSALDGAEPGSDQQLAFAASFPEIAQAMRQGGPEILVLRRAWDEFSECLIDETAKPVCNTARPWGYFQKAVPRHPELTFWSNMSVGLGLVLTFLGIVVALDTAATGITSAARIEDSQAALGALLVVASAKFFASIGGLIASLILRYADSRFSRRSERDLHHLCDWLERGLSYTPLQRLAMLQLEELKSQTTQLEKFNTDLALSIGEQMQQKFANVMAPTQELVSRIGDGLSGMTESLSRELGAGARKAIEEATRGELHELALTLESLRKQIQSASIKLESALDGATDRLKAAGGELGQAASEVKASFEALADGIDASLQHATETAEAFTASAASAHEGAEALQVAADRFGAASEPVRSASESVRVAADALKESVDAGTESATRVHTALFSLANDLRSTSKSAADSWESYRERFEGVDKSLEAFFNGLGATLSASLQQFEAFAAKFDSELATAVSRLASTVSLLQESCETIAAYAEAISDNSTPTKRASEAAQ